MLKLLQASRDGARVHDRDVLASVTSTVLTGPRAPQEVHHEDATTRHKQPDATGIDDDSGRDQYEAVRKDLQGSAYPHPRTGHKGAPWGRLWGAGATPRGHRRDFYWCGPLSSASQLFRTLKTPARGQCIGRWRPGARPTGLWASSEERGKGVNRFITPRMCL
eukprot:7383225-Prymnesium_polylepis.4